MDKFLCYYTIAHYIPDPIRGEFVNIGVVLQSTETGFIGSKFLNDYRRIEDFNPHVNKLVLDDFATVSRDKITHMNRSGLTKTADRISSAPEFITLLSRLYSGLVQYSKPKVVLANNPVEELDRLYEELVSPPLNQRKVSVPEQHKMITATKGEEHHRYTVASVRRDVVRSLLNNPKLQSHIKRKYEVQGSVNSWVFDVGLRNGAIHVVQTVSFDVDAAEAKQDRALILKGKIDDARSANQRVGFNAYAIVLPPTDNNEGYKESLKLLNSSEIITCEPEQVYRVVNELEKKITTH